MPALAEEGDVIRHLRVNAKRLLPVANKVTEFQLFLINKNLKAA